MTSPHSPTLLHGPVRTKNLYVHNHPCTLLTATLEMEAACTSETLAALPTFTRCAETEEQNQHVFMTDLLSE